MAFLSYVYQQRIPDQSSLYFDDFMGTYRGFKFAKEKEYQLYYMLCPEGKILPSSLAPRFTKMTLLQDAVDTYLRTNPTGELQDAPFPQPKRSHHKTGDNDIAVLSEEKLDEIYKTNNDTPL
jgi:hypothetical protein